jgi:hypothetical protein
MGVVAYAFLFLSIIGCITYGLVNWSKESTVPSTNNLPEENTNRDKS